MFIFQFETEWCFCERSKRSGLTPSGEKRERLIKVSKQQKDED